MNPLKDIKPAKVAGLEFMIVDVTPAMAVDWLQRNKSNRNLRTMALKSLAIDLENGNWLLTHQGIAFNDVGDLIDGQHRLTAIAQVKKAARLFVSAGWPSGKVNTMDAVDRGHPRSIGDVLKINGVAEGARIAQLVSSTAAACMGTNRIEGNSVATTVQVAELFKKEFTWIIGMPKSETRGINMMPVLSVVVLGRALWPDKTSDFLTRLRTGENLSSKNPVLHLRNWLLRDDILAQTKSTVRMATAHALSLFVDGKDCSRLETDNPDGLVRMLKDGRKFIEKVCAIYHSELPEVLTGKPRSNSTQNRSKLAVLKEQRDAVMPSAPKPAVPRTADRPSIGKILDAAAAALDLEASEIIAKENAEAVTARTAAICVARQKGHTAEAIAAFFRRTVDAIRKSPARLQMTRDQRAAVADIEAEL